MTKTFEEERMDEFEVSCILKCYKLIYIERLTYGKSNDAFKLLGGDLIYRELLKAHEEGRICLDITNFEAIKYVKEKLPEIQKRSISAIYDREFTGLGWLRDIVCCGLDPSDTLRDTIVNYLKFGTFNEEELYGRFINEKEHVEMAKNAKIIYPKLGTFNEEKLDGKFINEKEHVEMAKNAKIIYDITKKKK